MSKCISLVGGAAHYDNFSGFASKGVAATAAVSGSATLIDACVINPTGGDLYLQIFDLATAPSLGAVPDHVLFVPRGSQQSISFAQGFRCDTGLAWGLSTTLGTFTDAVTTTVGVTLAYR